jgi:transglutaminase-like putative cysteine protease
VDGRRAGGSESGSLTRKAILFQVPNGPDGTAATLEHLRALARAGAASPIVRAAAWRAAGMTPFTRKPDRLREWLARHTAFEEDPPGVELVREPETLILDQLLPFGRIAADCDDIATLAAALGLALGLRARFLVIGFSREDGFSHIWTALACPGGHWVDCDPTRPDTVPPIARGWALEV